jgi:flagellar biosynthesis protein FlhG
MDQAGTLRKLMSGRVAIRPMSMRPVRVISVTSGKGGVGKTNIVANLAVQLQKSGHKVLVLDGDFGLANMNIVMGLEAKHTIYDVLSGEKELSDVMLDGPHGVKLIPATSGIFKMTQLSMTEKSILMERLEASPHHFDVLLIDTGAGINSDVAYLNSAATEVIVVATPEPTSIADAYALMKVMSQDYRVKRFKLLVNMVDSPKDALGVYNNLLNVSDRFLNIGIEYLGHILRDSRVSQAVLARKVLCDAWPDTAASRCFEAVSKSLMETPAKSELTGNVQFFWRTLLSEASL